MRLFCFFLLVLAVNFSAALSTKLSNACRAEDSTASLLSYTGTDFFPSYVISTATVDWNGDEQFAEDKKSDQDPELQDDETPLYGDENGSVGVELTDIANGSRVRVEMQVDGFMKKSKWEGDIEDDYDFIHIFPKARWDYNALRKNTQQKPATLIVRVFVDDELIEEIDETVLIRSVNECPYYIQIGENADEIEDISVTFAAYVNENHPWIDELLKEALAATKESELINGFTGYQQGDPEAVIAQVFAIWNALQRRGIKYSDVSTSIPSKLVYCQTVRFVDDTVKSSQANCVDGSVLMASALRRIGLDAYLVMVPGHCYLAFSDGNKENPTLWGLETTMLGSNNLKAVTELPNLPDALKQQEFADSFATFSAALEHGTEDLNKNAPLFDSGEDPNTQLISINEARELGVMPLGAENQKP